MGVFAKDVRSVLNPAKRFGFAALAEDAIEYRIETTYASEDYPDSAYQGWPTAEKDKLWNKFEGKCGMVQHLALYIPRYVPD